MWVWCGYMGVGLGVGVHMCEKNMCVHICVYVYRCMCVYVRV